MKPIAILGAGAWGTALAIHLASSNHEVRLWSMVDEEIQTLKKERTNSRFLPGIALPESIDPTSDLKTAINGVEIVIVAIPSVAYEKTLKLLKEVAQTPIKIVSATKGLDEESGEFLHQVIMREMGESTPFAIISGPSFAKEVALKKPTSLMIASKDSELITTVTNYFQTDTLRLFATDDVIGVEIGAIIKNIVAIAVGLSDGLAFGANARSAIITQGLRDMMALGKKFGANTQTLMGLACAGDLILTCTDDQSRNRRFGLALGKGKTIADAEAEIGQVVEGKNNLNLALKLAKKHHLKLVIAEALAKLFSKQITAEATLAQILTAYS